MSEKISTSGEVSTCPACGYKDGFHVSFSLDQDSKGQVVLICPSCHKHFNIGWPVQLT